MRKIFFTTVITFFVLIVGQTLYYNSIEKRNNNFINGDVYQNLKDNKIEEFVDSSFLVLGVDSYYKEPVYKFNSDKIKVSFFIGITNNEKALYPFYYDVEREDSIKSLDIKITTNASNIVIRNEISLFDSKYNYVGGGFFTPIYFNDSNFYYKKGSSNVIFSEIRSFEINSTYIEESIKDKELVIINANNNLSINKVNEATLNNEDGIFTSKEFSGKLSEYNKLDFNDSEKITPSKDKFKPYNGIITRNIVIYLFFVVLAALYSIFRKRIFNLFSKKKVS